MYFVEVTRHTSKMPFLIFLPAEIEAKEACTWLRAAGFPQYAQLYEGEEINLSSHTFKLDKNWMFFEKNKSLIIEHHILFTTKSVKGSFTRQNKALWKKKQNSLSLDKHTKHPHAEKKAPLRTQRSQPTICKRFA